MSRLCLIRAVQLSQEPLQAGSRVGSVTSRATGSTISVEFTITPLKDETGKLIGMAAVMRDVTK
jgi:hypothetical protein